MVTFSPWLVVGRVSSHVFHMVFSLCHIEGFLFFSFRVLKVLQMGFENIQMLKYFFECSLVSWFKHNYALCCVIQ